MCSRVEPVALFREMPIDVLKIGLNLRKVGSRSKVKCSLKSALIWLGLLCLSTDPSYLSSQCDKLQQDFLATSFEPNSSDWLTRWIIYLMNFTLFLKDLPLKLVFHFPYSSARWVLEEFLTNFLEVNAITVSKQPSKKHMFIHFSPACVVYLKL